jgi:hypothetical protein
MAEPQNRDPGAVSINGIIRLTVGTSWVIEGWPFGSPGVALDCAERGRTIGP